MLKLVSVIRRKKDMDVEAFQQHWRQVHAPIVLGLPGLRRYVQSHTLLSGYASHAPVFDGIAELWFDDTDDLRAIQGSAQLAAVEADGYEFMDTDALIQLFVVEHVIKNGPTTPDGVKNVELVKRKHGMPVGEFQAYWREHHGPLAAEIGPVQRYVQNHARTSSYRDDRSPPLDGLAITWFNDTSAMRESATTTEYATTRDDEENFLTTPLDFIITREHIVLG